MPCLHRTMQFLPGVLVFAAALTLVAALLPWTASEGDAASNGPAGPETQEKSMTLVLTTNHGDISIELDAEKAPVTVENFLRYADEGFFNETIFHRVIPGFMIQGGGMTEEMIPKRGHPPIKNEAPAPRTSTAPPVSSLSTSRTTPFWTMADGTSATRSSETWWTAWTWSTPLPG